MESQTTEQQQKPKRAYTITNLNKLWGNKQVGHSYKSYNDMDKRIRLAFKHAKKHYNKDYIIFEDDFCFVFRVVGEQKNAIYISQIDKKTGDLKQ